MKDASLSRSHCSLLMEGSANCKLFLTVEDLGSSNGTFVNGKRLDRECKSTCRHEPGHVLAFGECKDAFRVIEDIESDEDEEADGGNVSVQGCDAVQGNRRYGIKFNYDDAGPSQRRRSRSAGRRRLQRREEQRCEQREKRRSLWSGKQDRSGDDPGPDAAEQAKPSGMPCTDRSANGWEKSSFSSQAEKSKFLRLMGAKDMPANSQEATKLPTRSQFRQQEQELERQYWLGMRQQMSGRGRGLGAG